LPLRPLSFAGGDFGVKRFGDVADGDAVKGLGDELFLFPEHLLEVFDLRQEFDDVHPHALDEAQELKPALAQALAGGFHFLQVEYLVLQVKVQFAGEKALQAFVDKKVGGVAAGILA